MLGKRLGLVVLVAGALMAVTVPAHSSQPPAVIGHAGRWMVDPSGRVIILHGVNVSSKGLPAYPSALGFDDDDAAFLASEGFDAVRLTVERYAVEPSPGQFDDSYLTNVAATIKMLAANGIYSLIDFHQDEYGPVFHDNGYPSWMTMTDGLPNVWQVGFPAQYVANPALERAFDHLWENSIGPDGQPLQSDDAAILAHVAQALRDLPDVLGYEILNEPWPGSAFPTCIEPGVGCPLFDEGPLTSYYQRMDTALRNADSSHLVWYEPLVLFNYGIPTHVMPPKDQQLGFAFHDYGLCSDTPAYDYVAAACGAEDSLVLSNAVSYSAETGNALLNTEFGATTDPAQITQQVTAFDRARIPWMWWSYAEIDPTGPGGTFDPPTSANLHLPVLASLARPYPQVVAGTPVAWNFDPTTKVFTFTYTTDRADGHGRFPPGEETEIAVPPIQYPGGYSVKVTGATVTSPAGSSVLTVSSAPGASTVEVEVRSAP